MNEEHNIIRFKWKGFTVYSLNYPEYNTIPYYLNECSNLQDISITEDLYYCIMNNFPFGEDSNFELTIDQRVNCLDDKFNLFKFVNMVTSVDFGLYWIDRIDPDKNYVELNYNLNTNVPVRFDMFVSELEEFVTVNGEIDLKKANVILNSKCKIFPDWFPKYNVLYDKQVDYNGKVYDNKTFNPYNMKKKK